MNGGVEGRKEITKTRDEQSGRKEERREKLKS